ncbi:protein unc-79 homolog isoform X6 [Phlebotomus papatasi]|uniref:protein unc-79 homolog isoform X6 n=1 Tax=Phlebotomus papatasi TaxID=29031 RepID=UPI0024838411|nr:protein unc-79 homolog isoform X6 [Phlebotomus papatasi]
MENFRVQLINMGTRAAAYQAKLRCLYDYHLRLLHNIIPLPSGVDIANNIKYFSQTLLTLLKDVPSSPYQMIKDPTQDQARMSAYPNLEYGNLYNALNMLLDVASNIQYGLVMFGKAVLQCLGCILPFLDRDLIDNLPYLTASCISVLPPSLHQDIINSLCFYILPFTITRQSVEDQECQACQSVSAVIMLVFQYSSNPGHHCQLLECLMTLKHNVVKDLLCVIAYGTAASRSSAAKLLFYYWPAFNTNLFDRRGLLCKFTSKIFNLCFKFTFLIQNILSDDLVPFVCQRESCPNAGNAEAVKVCYNHNISIIYAPESPPPLYLCIECANDIHREHPDQTFVDILHPMQQVSMVCENKNCRSTDKSAVSICFSTECASYNGNHPIRYCLQCHGNRHNSRRGGDHVVHQSLPVAWHMDAEMQTYMVESVVSLLRESKPQNFEPGKDSTVDSTKPSVSNAPQDNISLEERQQLGRYGIWLLVGRCTPTQDTPVEILGRLLSMLFHWFHVTAYSTESQLESPLEKLKIEHVCGWLKDICESHYKDFIACLLPHPPEYSRVGGHWDTLASRTSHLKEGLQRLICLVPYEVITSEIWDFVMPHWMEAITNDVPEKELPELKIVLSKILDPDMSPLGFDAKTMYNFVTIRFEKTTSKVQQQALHWLQILTKLEILIPLPQLFAMFGDGVRIMKQGAHHDMKEKERKDGKPIEKKEQAPRRSSISPVVEDDSDGNTSAISDEDAPQAKTTEFATDAENNLTCCILMLDILLKQMELQDIEQHMGIHTSVCENVCRLLKCMVTAAKVGMGSHTCGLKIAECGYCEASVMWHQLSTKLVQFMAPMNPTRPPDPPIEEIFDDERSARKSPPETEKEAKGRDRDVSLSMAPLPIPLGPLGGFSGPVPVVLPQPPEPHSIGGVLVSMPNVCSGREQDIARFIHATDEPLFQIMTATVETVSEQLDLAAIMPSEKVVTAVARSVTLSDADVATATVQVAKPNLVGPGSEGDRSGDGEDGGDELEDGEDFWHTSVGKFKFALDSLPQQLQYIHQLLKELPNIEKPDILYHMLQCLNILALHGDALSKAARDQRGFFIWCQENLIIKNLWDLCNAEHSHICESGVPLLLHCITLPHGSDVFWRIVQEAFHDSDWRVRFTAVERVTVITRFMDSTPLRSEVGLQTALATAFCHLIASMDDINVHVAQRATLYLGTIHDNAVKSLLFCLESQFDLFIVDRPVVLQSVYQLHNSLSDRHVLAWDFFLNRFDTLFVEAQVNLEKNGDISYLRDLRNSENGSEILSSKISKAREALSQSDGTGSMAKTLSASFGPKWPYKRTMSAPASIIPRQDSKMEKEKVYNRQISAPILKRKSSRFGLGQFLLSGTNHSHTSSVATQHSHSHHHHFAHPHPHHSSPASQSGSGTAPSTPNLTAAHQHVYQFPAPGAPASGSASGAPDGHFHSFGGAGEDTLSSCLHRIIDLEEQDKETIHLLVFLLMQFMSRSDQAFPAEENKPMAKAQSIVLRHLYLLLGFSQHEKNFQMSPGRLRNSTVFNVFLANLPQVLDQNHLMGWTLLPTALQVLLYAPNPMNGSSAPTAEAQANLAYTYSLWYLEPHQRRNWLMAVIVILYKYQYTQPPFCTQINHIIRIVLNCLESQFHQCKRIPATVIMDLPVSARSRDVSQPSLGTDPDDKIQETPPASPILVAAESSGASSRTKPTPKATFRKYHDSSLEADDTESELVAIPESDLSDSTLHGSSAPGSFDDPLHFEEICAPLKPEILRNKATAHVTTANLATAHVAMSTLTPGDRVEEKTETTMSRKTQRTIVASGAKINEPVVHKTTTLESTSVTTTKSSVVTVQDGVKHLIAAGQAKERAILNPPVTVQRAVVVSQTTVVKEPEKSTGNEPDSGSEAKKGTSNWTEQPAPSPTPRTLGRQKRVIEPSITPASTPTSNAGLPSPSNEDTAKGNNSKAINKKSFKVIEKPESFGSPDSPLSKMSIMTQPSQDSSDGLLSPKSIQQLEIPTPERLLPIGQHGKEGIAMLAERVREALTIPEVCHIKQDSLEKSDSDQKPSSRGSSPRRLIKQVALVESPPSDLHQTVLRAVTHEPRDRISGTRTPEQFRIQRARAKKVFPEPSTSLDRTTAKYAGSWQPLNFKQEDSEPEDDSHHSQASESRRSSYRVGDDCVCGRCGECGAVLEEYSDEEIGILIIILGTFIHREPTLAAPFLPEILLVVSKFAMQFTFPWQCESTTHLPGGSQSVAHQFIRCVLHQLAPNGVFIQMFLTQANETHRRKFFKSVAQALMDFNELNPTSPIHLLVESLNSKKTLPLDTLPVTLRNLAEYLQCLPSDIGPGVWSTTIQGIDALFRRLVLILHSLEEPESLLDIMVCLLKIQGVSKAVLDPFSKVLSFAVQNLTLKHKIMQDLCLYSSRAFSRERDKLQLCRQMVFELVQALKFKTNIPDANLLLLVGFVLQDAGGAVPPGIVAGLPDHPPIYTNNSGECMRQYLNDVMDFLADFHTLSKIKNFKSGSVAAGLTEDTLGGVLKGAVAQYLALEMSRGNSRDNKAVARYLPWLYNAPSSLQQGPKEFTECVGHMRLLSWLLMGSLTHTALMAQRSGPIGQHGASVHYHLQHPAHTVTQPVPQEASCHIADHIQVIFAGFAEQSKTSVLHMSSLFHAFTLCQLWTVYLEQASCTAAPSSEPHNVTMSILLEFWAKVTPCILQLITHSKVLSEMVNLHFLSLLEALKETKSTILAKLLPLWSPVLSSNTQLSGTLHVRLQSCRDLSPSPAEQDLHASDALLKWLQRLQFKMGQIELQSSTATQFYSI